MQRHNESYRKEVGYLMRMSSNTALNGYDYDKQAWYQNGVYIRCGHPEAMDCNCFGKINEGMAVAV
jgi:hypothetical protein